MMRLTAIALAVLLAAVDCSAQGTCEPMECLRRINMSVPIERVELTDVNLVGGWQMGLSGLGGTLLYLFADRTYVQTDWTDVQPEMVEDFGRWRVAEGVLRLVGDQAIKWPVSTDRVFISLRPDGMQDLHWLLGLRTGVGGFEFMGGRASDLRAFAFSRTTVWAPAKGQSIKAKLMTECWRPDILKRRASRRTRG